MHEFNLVDVQVVNSYTCNTCIYNGMGYIYARSDELWTIDDSG